MMEASLNQVLQLFQAVLNHFENLGLSPFSLALIAISLFFLGLLALREAMSWFVHTQALRAELRAVNERLERIERSLESFRPETHEILTAPTTIKSDDRAEHFPISH